MADREPIVLHEEIEPGVHRVMLNRPERRNAYSTELLKALLRALHAIEETPDARVVILRGAGPVFCGGLDLREASASDDSAVMPGMVVRLLSAIHRSRLVYIAAAHGAARAGGAALAVSCDYVVAADDFTIGFPEVRIGLTPSLLLPLLQRKLSDVHLRELLLSGRPVSARRAVGIGLIHEAVPEASLDDAALAYARETLLGAPEAVAKAKAMILAVHSTPIEEAFRAALEEHVDAWNAPSAKEGVRAFLEKRKPGWA